jgi:predicted MFS family arabinose efflux permease
MNLLALLRRNANYRYLWTGQVVSEIGAAFNTVAVLALIMEKTGSGLIVSLMFLSRAIPSVAASPFAGVLLDRLERRHVMIASDVFRAAVAVLFVLTVDASQPTLLYVLSGLLSFAAPFFTAGRAAILPSIATPEELHTANSITQTTGWATQSAGAILGGWGVVRLGYHGAFVLNAVCFVFSAWCVWRIAMARRAARGARQPKRGTQEYLDGLRYIRSVPLAVGIGMISVGWAVGGGAAQILFALFGEQVFHRGPQGIGNIWGFAGIGLLIGGALGHAVGRRATYASYKRAVALSYLAHGGGYMLFSQVESFAAALALIAFSRIGMAVASVLNTSQLLQHTPDEYLGRVFATMESLRNSIMIFSMAAAGVASQYAGPRTIGLIAGGFGMLTAALWAWADWSGRLPEPVQPAPIFTRNQ